MRSRLGRCWTTGREDCSTQCLPERCDRREGYLQQCSRRLLQGSVQAVVAMSASVTPPSAALYVKAFYSELALGSSVQAAHEQAQQVLHEHPERNPLQRRPGRSGKTCQSARLVAALSLCATSAHATNSRRGVAILATGFYFHRAAPEQYNTGFIHSRIYGSQRGIIPD